MLECRVTMLTRVARHLLPPGATPAAGLVLVTRALRAFGDGFVSLLLPFYLTALGFPAWQVGVLVTATLLGSGALTLAVGLLAHRWRTRTLLVAVSWLAIATGCAMALSTDFWPLLLIAVAGTVNPSAGDTTPFLPLEHALIARSVPAAGRTAMFARYSLVGALVAALGAQAAVLPGLASSYWSLDPTLAMQGMFALYAVLAALALLLYRRLGARDEPPEESPPTPLARSRRTVYTLAALFALDSFAGGFAVQSLLALWLHDRFGLSLAVLGTIFFWAGLLAAFSFPVAAWLARRIGLVNTMVFTHLPANVFLILVPLMPTLPLALTFLLLRFALSSMDVPARSSYVMAVVTPRERPAAASVTAVPRSLASAVSPMIAGWMMSLSPFGWPLVVCGGLKIVYDLSLLYMFRHVRPPEERQP